MYFCRFLVLDNNDKEYVFKSCQCCTLLLYNIYHKIYLSSFLAAFWRQKAKTDKFNFKYYFSLIIIHTSADKVHEIFYRNF